MTVKYAQDSTFVDNGTFFLLLNDSACDILVVRRVCSTVLCVLCRKGTENNMREITVVSKSENASCARALVSDDLTAVAIGLGLVVLVVAPTWWTAVNHGLLYAALAGFCTCGLLCSGGVICACLVGKRSEA